MITFKEEKWCSTVGIALFRLLEGKCTHKCVEKTTTKTLNVCVMTAGKLLKPFLKKKEWKCYLQIHEVDTNRAIDVTLIYNVTSCHFGRLMVKCPVKNEKCSILDIVYSESQALWQRINQAQPFLNQWTKSQTKSKSNRIFPHVYYHIPGPSKQRARLWL